MSIKLSRELHKLLKKESLANERAAKAYLLSSNHGSVSIRCDLMDTDDGCWSMPHLSSTLLTKTYLKVTNLGFRPRALAVVQNNEGGRKPGWRPEIGEGFVKLRLPVLYYEAGAAKAMKTVGFVHTPTRLYLKDNAAKNKEEFAQQA